MRGDVRSKPSDVAIILFFEAPPHTSFTPKQDVLPDLRRTPYGSRVD